VRTKATLEAELRRANERAEAVKTEYGRWNQQAMQQYASATEVSVLVAVVGSSSW
jgi:hypothetical protein